MSDFTDPALARFEELRDALGAGFLLSAAERVALLRICEWGTAGDILALARVIRRARGEQA